MCVSCTCYILRTRILHRQVEDICAGPHEEVEGLDLVL